ncbi:hypothetical protein KK449_18240 [Clostridioides difficile]|nr:hypothetical protein [Clostridioides difficile]
MYGWGSSTICNILEKREYLGHTINFKTRKHFKDKKSHYVPEDEWTILRIPMSLSLTSRPLTLCRKSVGMSDATRTAGAKQLPHRLALLCRLRRQDVCPPYQQRQAHFSIHLLTVHKSSLRDTLQDPAPYQ